MGRELKRVPLDFNWPLNKPWQGYLNPLHTAKRCCVCGGDGASPEARHLRNLWYGYEPFDPKSTGSTPFIADEGSPVWERAKRQCRQAPEYYGASSGSVLALAEHLCRNFNSHWSHHLDADDVMALVAEGRLMDLTHTWSPETRWQPKSPPYMPSPPEVNRWSIQGMGHDSINQWVCVKAKCKRLGVAYVCANCQGEGDIWPTPEAKAAYDNWKEVEPPVGVAYQIWETVSEGSPISPPFSTPEGLAKHMAMTKWGADKGTSYETWLAFIHGPGLAPSMVSGPFGLVTGVTAVVGL